MECFPVLQFSISFCYRWIWLSGWGTAYTLCIPTGWSAWGFQVWAEQHLWVQAILGGAQPWHYQLRQHPLCYAHRLPMHHHGGLDHCAVLCELILSYIFSQLIGANSLMSTAVNSPSFVQRQFDLNSYRLLLLQFIMNFFFVLFV